MSRVSSVTRNFVYSFSRRQTHSTTAPMLSWLNSLDRPVTLGRQSLEIHWRSAFERAMIEARDGGSNAGLRSEMENGGPMSRDFNVVIERDSEGYYVASVPALPGCHTQARSLDELAERIKEAIALYLEVEAEAPEPLDFVGIQRVTVAR